MTKVKKVKVRFEPIKNSVTLELRYLKMNTESKGIENIQQPYVKGLAIYDTQSEEYLSVPYISAYAPLKAYSGRYVTLDGMVVFKDKTTAKQIIKALRTKLMKSE